MKDLRLHLSQQARDHLQELLASRREGALPALLLGKSPTRWELVAYEKSQAETLVATFAAAGHELLFRVDDLVLLVPQGEALARELLENKHLDIREGTLVLRESHDG